MDNSLYETLCNSEIDYVKFVKEYIDSDSKVKKLKEALKTYKKVWIINPTQATKVLREAYTMRSDIRDLLSVIPAYTPQYLEPYCHFLNHEFNSKTSLTCFQHLIKLENTTDQQILTTINLAMKNQEFILAYNLLTKNLKATLDIPKYQKHFAHLESAWLGEKVALEDTDEWGFDTLESCPLIRWRFAAAQSVNDKKRALSSLEKLSRCPQYADARQLKYLKLSMHNAFHEHGQALKILQSLNNVLTPELGLLLRQANKEIHLKLYKRAESTYKKMVQQNPTNASVISLGKKLANIENEKQEQWLRKGL